MSQNSNSNNNNNGSYTADELAWVVNHNCQPYPRNDNSEKNNDKDEK